MSEADALQLLARLRRGEDIDSLLEAGRQMLRRRDGTYEPTVRSITRRASVDGIIPIVPLEARSMSDHLAAIVASTPLTVLEPNVDLGVNLRNLDAAEYVSPTLRLFSLRNDCSHVTRRASVRRHIREANR